MCRYRTRISVPTPCLQTLPAFPTYTVLIKHRIFNLDNFTLFIVKIKDLHDDKSKMNSSSVIRMPLYEKL
jgi:hypothetical protein